MTLKQFATVATETYNGVVKTKTIERLMNPWSIWQCAKVPLWMLKNPQLTPQAKLLYGLLCYRAGQKGHCWPSQERLAEDIGMDVRTVKRRTKELVDVGLLVISRRCHSQTNIYSFPAPAEMFEVGLVMDEELENEGTHLLSEAPSEVTSLARSEGTPVTPRITKKGITKKNQGSEVTVPDVLQAAEFIDAWEKWETYRKEAKHKLTPSTKERQLATLAKHGPRVAALMIFQSIEKGWSGLFELKGDALPPGYKRGQRPPPRPGDSGSLKSGGDYAARLNIAGKMNP